jgi:site-specific DNA-cytosine methylase
MPDRPLRYLSVCSGIEAATQAWHPLGWRPDGPRYKALGNSWAVNVAEWVGERINEVDGW